MNIPGNELKELVEIMQKVNKNAETLGEVLSIISKLIDRIKDLEEKLK